MQDKKFLLSGIKIAQNKKSKPDKVEFGFLVEVTGPTVCFAYYPLVDPMLRIRYPTARSLLKTVHRTVFYAADLLRFESCNKQKIKRNQPYG